MSTKATSISLLFHRELLDSVDLLETEQLLCMTSSGCDKRIASDQYIAVFFTEDVLSCCAVV